MHFLFVYGTLKKGGIYHHLLRGMTATPAIAPHIELHAGPLYPFARKGTGEAIGEVYRVNTAKLIEIDHLERHPNEYHRELTPVLLAGDKIIKAWIYLHPVAAKRYPLISSGLWLPSQSYFFKKQRRRDFI